MEHQRGSKWTSEMDAQLTEMRARRATAQEIAEAMGLTRGQVESRAKRLPAKRSAGLAQPSSPNPIVGVVGIGQIAKQYDTRDAIFRELVDIQSETVVEQAELTRRVCGTDRTRFNRCVELHADEFKNYRVQMRLGDHRDYRWYWGQPEFVAKVRALVEKYK